MLDTFIETFPYRYILVVVLLWTSIFYLLAAISSNPSQGKRKWGFSPPFHRKSSVRNWLLTWALWPYPIILYFFLRQNRIWHGWHQLYADSGYLGPLRLLLVAYLVSFVIIGPLILHNLLPLPQLLQKHRLVNDHKKIRRILVVLVIIAIAALVAFAYAYSPADFT